METPTFPGSSPKELFDFLPHRAAGGWREDVAGVETTTRRACAAPLRLGSIRAHVFRRRVLGTGPFDPCHTLPPSARHP